MALKPILDSIDDLPDPIKEHYTPGEGELDGKFVLGVTAHNGFELANTENLKKTLVKERTQRQEFEKRFKGVEDLLGDPDAARDALKKVADFDNWDPEKKNEEYKKQLEKSFETEKSKLVNKYEQDLTKASEQSKTYANQLQKVLVEDKAVQAIAKVNGNAKLLLPHVVSRLRTIQDEDGTFKVQVIDDEGLERLSPRSGQTAPMTVEELLDEMSNSDEYAICFKGSNQGGSGAGGDRGDPGSNNSRPYILSETDARDPYKYRAAKEAAAKAGRSLEIKA